MENQLSKIVTESGLEQTKAQVILTNFQNYFDIASEWEAKVNSLNVTDVSQVAEMKMAREARLFLKARRIDVENTRKQLKEQSLREGQTIDHIAGILKNLIIPIEEKAEKIEKFKELKEAAELAQRTTERIELLIPFNVAVDSNFIGVMPEETFQAYLTGLKVEKEQREAAEKKAEEERIEKERIDNLYFKRCDEISHLKDFFHLLKDFDFVQMGTFTEEKFQAGKAVLEKANTEYKEEQERIRLDNIRLKAEAEEKEKALEIERKKQAEELAKQKAEAEKKAKEEAEKQAKIQAELNAKLEAERKANEAKLKAEAEEKARIQAELDAKKQAEAAELAKKEAEERARKEAEEKAAKAPDKEKLKAWVNSFAISQSPDTSNVFDPTKNVIEEKFKAFKTWAITQIENI